MKIIDAHIHLDQYTNKDIQLMLEDSDSIEALVSVSYDLDSCKRNLYLSTKYQKVKPAFGFHPEQSLPTENVLGMLFEWLIQHQSDMMKKSISMIAKIKTLSEAEISKRALENTKKLYRI